jgi:mono/diheme cytochrome c family protein
MNGRDLLKLLLLVFVGLTTLLFADMGDGAWLRKVPAKERARQNPFAHNPQAAAAGEKLFEENCASCHGVNEEGKKDRPGLHSDRVRNASPGELHWLLTNGSLKNGMPNWSKLPDPERWQLVTFLKTLK